MEKKTPRVGIFVCECGGNIGDVALPPEFTGKVPTDTVENTGLSWKIQQILFVKGMDSPDVVLKNSIELLPSLFTKPIHSLLWSKSTLLPTTLKQLILEHLIQDPVEAADFNPDVLRRKLLVNLIAVELSVPEHFQDDSLKIFRFHMT